MSKVSPTQAFVAIGLSLLLFATGCSSKSPVEPSQIGTPSLGSADPGAGGRSLVIGPIGRATVTPVFVEGNPSCTSLGYDFGFKVDPPNAGTYTIPGYGTVTVTTDGVNFDWSSTKGMDAVIAKGGPNSNVYVYDPPQEATSDTGLHSPINSNTGNPFGLSHIEFCFDFELVVTKTANTSYDRDFDWTIVKTADKTSIELSSDQTFTVNYTITVTKGPAQDSNFAVSGNITVHNPAPSGNDATGVVVTDVIDPSTGVTELTVNCPSTTVAAGATMTCTYSAKLPDGTSRTNTATATPSGGNLNPGSGTAQITFGDPTNVTDNSVTIDDSYSGGPQDDVINASKTYTYARIIDAGELPICGENLVTNTATLTSDDGSPKTDDHTVTVTKSCENLGGCTLTQGYWKTHSDRGPAPYDSNWALLGALQEDTPFFNSDKTYYQVLWTAPAGNAYFILAHQYIAATLNDLAGADTSAITSQLASATTLFTNYPAGTAAPTGSLRQQFLTLAAALDAYNNGVTGPGHCSEQ